MHKWNLKYLILKIKYNLIKKINNKIFKKTMKVMVNAEDVRHLS
jgi:hypothetical protein